MLDVHHEDGWGVILHCSVEGKDEIEIEVNFEAESEAIR